MLTGYGDPSHGCLRAFGKTGQEKLTGRRRVYATSTNIANAGNSPVIPRRYPGSMTPEPRQPVSLAGPATVPAPVAVPAPVPVR